MITLLDKVYLVSFCHGDYDGHTKTPVIACTTFDEAEFFIHDVIKNWKKYKNSQCCSELIGYDWEFEHGQIFDYNFDIDTIPIFEV